MSEKPVNTSMKDKHPAEGDEDEHDGGVGEEDLEAVEEALP